MNLFFPDRGTGTGHKYHSIALRQSSVLVHHCTQTPSRRTCKALIFCMTDQTPMKRAKAERVESLKLTPATPQSCFLMAQVQPETDKEHLIQHLIPHIITNRLTASRRALPSWGLLLSYHNPSGGVATSTVWPTHGCTSVLWFIMAHDRIGCSSQDEGLTALVNC